MYAYVVIIMNGYGAFMLRKLTRKWAFAHVWEER